MALGSAPMKACGCVMGPPAGGLCRACGAVGAPLPIQYLYPPVYAPMPYAPGCAPTYGPICLTADDVRRIVREELERAASKPNAQVRPGSVPGDC